MNYLTFTTKEIKYERMTSLLIIIFIFNYMKKHSGIFCRSGIVCVW